MYANRKKKKEPPHDPNEQHYHDEVGGVLAPGFVLVQATGYKHLQAADDSGGEHLNGTWRGGTTKTKK